MKLEMQVIAGLIIAVLLAVGISLWGSHYMNLQREAALAKTRAGVLTTTSQGVADGTRIDQAQATTNAALAQGRETFHVTIQEAKRNEPETANRAVRPVPDSVRNAAAERRRARERLGCAGGECDEGRHASPTP
jgi:hypothetical protein